MCKRTRVTHFNEGGGASAAESTAGARAAVLKKLYIFILFYFFEEGTLRSIRGHMRDVNVWKPKPKRSGVNQGAISPHNMGVCTCVRLLTHSLLFGV